MILISVPILLFGGVPFKLFVSLLASVSLFEMIKIRRNKKDFPLSLKIISFIILCLMVFNNILMPELNIDYKHLIIFFGLYFFPVVFIHNSSKYNINDAFYLICCVLFLGTIFSFIGIIRENNLLRFIYLLLITVFTDTFALITGKYFGKHKLCESISPNKTIEGSIGGSILGTTIATIFYIMFVEASMNIFVLIFITLLLSIVGQFGDLFFSSIKRIYKVKDFSNLIPGHGGILDRFDSFIFVVMIYMLFINIL